MYDFNLVKGNSVWFDEVDMLSVFYRACSTQCASLGCVLQGCYNVKKNIEETKEGFKTEPFYGNDSKSSSKRKEYRILSISNITNWLSPALGFFLYQNNGNGF